MTAVLGCDAGMGANLTYFSRYVDPGSGSQGPHSTWFAALTSPGVVYEGSSDPGF